MNGAKGVERAREYRGKPGKTLSLAGQVVNGLLIGQHGD